MFWDLAGKGLTASMGICLYALLVVAGLVGSLVLGASHHFEKRCRKSPSSGPISLGCLPGLLPGPVCLEPVCLSSVMFFYLSSPSIPPICAIVCVYVSLFRTPGGLFAPEDICHFPHFFLEFIGPSFILTSFPPSCGAEESWCPFKALCQLWAGSALCWQLLRSAGSRALEAPHKLEDFRESTGEKEAFLHTLALSLARPTLWVPFPGVPQLLWACPADLHVTCICTCLCVCAHLLCARALCMCMSVCFICLCVRMWCCACVHDVYVYVRVCECLFLCVHACYVPTCFSAHIVSVPACTRIPVCSRL